MEPLRALQTEELWIFLGLILACVFLPIAFISRLMPAVIPEGHPDTKWIDGLRGIAASIVSLNHAPFVLVNLAITPQVFYISQADSRFPLMFGATGVQIFFCITGMLFAGKIFSQNPIDWTDFYAKRIRRILPAYLAAALLALIIGAWFSWPISQPALEVVAHLPSIFAFGLLPIPTINDFNFVRLLGVCWTLAIEWRFYLVLPIIYLAARRNVKATLAGIILFSIADLAISGLSSWSFFIPGVLCSFIARKKFSGIARVAASIAAALIIIFIFYRADSKTNYGLEQWLSIFALFATLTISRPSVLKAKLLVAMGSISYSFYLLHTMILFVTFGMLNRYWMDMGTLSITHFTIIAGASLSLASIVSTGSYLFIEKRFMHTPKSEKYSASASSSPI